MHVHVNNLDRNSTFSLAFGEFVNIDQQTSTCQSLCIRINFKFREFAYVKVRAISSSFVYHELSSINCRIIQAAYRPSN